jgi:hypothetical protein
MSINVEEQVVYWQNGAREELDTAELLLNNNKETVDRNSPPGGVCY